MLVNDSIKHAHANNHRNRNKYFFKKRVRDGKQWQNKIQPSCVIRVSEKFHRNLLFMHLHTCCLGFTYTNYVTTQGANTNAVGFFLSTLFIQFMNKQNVASVQENTSIL